MTELKAKHAFDVYEEYTKTGDDEQAQVYLKSEADRVIAELRQKLHDEEMRATLAEAAETERKIDYRNLKSDTDKVIEDLEESHRKEVEQLLVCNREQANAANRLRDSMEQVIRHQKYKRCMAMAKRCESESSWYYQFDNSSKVCTWYNRWEKRWLELAEKFKEEK